MAVLSFTNAAAVVASYIIYRFIKSFISDWRFKAFEKANGCQPPRYVKGKWPWGLDRLDRMIKSGQSGEDIIDDILAPLLYETSTLQRTVIGGQEMLETVDPENIQALLATQFKDFQLGPTRLAQFRPLLRNSIFSSDGAYWEHSRALLRPSFSRENINDLESTERAVQALIRAIGSTNESGWTETDLLPLFYRFTLDTATEFLFAESSDSQTAAIEGGGRGIGQEATFDDFTQDFTTVGEFLLQRIRLQGLYWLADGLKMRRAIKRIRNFMDHFVDVAVNSKENPEKSAKKYNLLSALAEQTRDKTEMKDQALAVLFAGRDTTAGLLGWAWMMLALHPEVFNKLRSTVLQDFPSGNNITFAQLKGCRYLQHFLNEVLRLYPTVPVNNRVPVRTTTLPRGGGPDQRSPVAVKKGTVVMYCVYAMHRREDLWGPDAAEFKPERWEKKIPAWQFLPFNGGPRICLGQQFAITEASYVFVRLLQRFDAVTPAPGTEMANGQKLTKGLSLTMYPGKGVKVQLHKA